jgi:hypothetical protein
MNIIKLAFEMTAAVKDFFGKARRFYYLVMLLGCRCPKCNDSLAMVGEGICRCNSCNCEFDPTVAFQRCSTCGGAVVLRVRRYYCKDCGIELRSKFLFDGLVFEKKYFRAKMAESRQRKKEQRERVRQMLAQSRSEMLPLEAMDLNVVPDLVDALNGLTAGLDTDFAVASREEFDLKRYQSHIQAHIQDFPMNLLDIPPLNDSRKDVIWRFVAVIFLAHTGIVDIWQEDSNIMVIKHVDRKRCDIFEGTEGADGCQRPLGGIEV